jgi:hypothetical protein
MKSKAEYKREWTKNNKDKVKAAERKFYYSEKGDIRNKKLRADFKKAREESKVFATKKRQEWTIQAIHQLEEMYHSGFTHKAIGIKMGRSLSSIGTAICKFILDSRK